MIGIILAGGSASRIGGGDKGERSVAGTPILDRMLAALRPQCDAIVINANGDHARFARHGLAVIADASPDRPGPLAGVLAGLDHVAMAFPGVAHVVTVPTDTPFLPLDLVARLQDSRVADRAMIVCASSGGRVHHATALWSVSLRADLRVALEREDVHKVEMFVARHPFAVVSWPIEPVDPFFNVNTADDLAIADRLARGDTA